MDREDAEAAIQFFGNIYAQAKQTDSMIVGSSQFVKPIGNDIKNSLENALQSHRVQQHQPPPPVYHSPAPEQTFTAPGPVMHPIPVQQPAPQPVPVEQSLLVDTLININKNLEAIRELLTTKNARKPKSKII